MVTCSVNNIAGIIRYRLIFSAAMSLLMASSYAADKSACEKVTGANEKLQCEANVGHDKSICERMTADKDAIKTCKAIASANSWACEKVDSSTKRLQCLNSVRDVQRKALWTLASNP